MSRYKAYPVYKDSGVVWLGRVPVHWASKRFKQVLADKKKTFNPSLEAGSISFGRVVFKDSDNLSQETKDSYQEVLSGEYLVNPLNLNYDLLSLRTALSEINVVVSTGYIVLKSTGVLKPRYIRWLLHEFDVSHMKTLGAGVRQTINYSDIGNSYFCAPTETEQEAISTFLDNETAKIDALIEKQRRLIELLKEKRQAVISHAVTKGLNPNASMKDSGVEWLGEVPAHWELLRIKFVCSFTTSGPRGWSELVGETGSLFIQSGDLSDTLSVNFSGSKRVQIGNDAEAKRTALCNGDVVVCITGAKTGNVALCDVVPEDAYINQHLCLIRPASIIFSAFLAVQLKSGLGQTYFELSQYGLKQGLSLENVREAPVLVPPLTEQIAIISYLNAEAEKFGVLSAKAQQSKELLHERRTALISAAVTGKIDVRDWQAAA